MTEVRVSPAIGSSCAGLTPRILRLPVLWNVEGVRARGQRVGVARARASPVESPPH